LELSRWLGEKTNAFLSGVDAKLERYMALWRLSGITFMPTHTINLLFACESALYGPCVLKMCIPGPEVLTEINCLWAYSGRGYVCLHAYECKDDVMLLERVLPGNQIWDVRDVHERARLFARVLEELPVINIECGSYPTYRSWMEGIHRTLSGMGGMDEPLFYLNEALRVYDALKLQYNRSCLLHGGYAPGELVIKRAGWVYRYRPQGRGGRPDFRSRAVYAE
jgi:hypothetical protein